MTTLFTDQVTVGVSNFLKQIIEQNCYGYYKNRVYYKVITEEEQEFHFCCANFEQWLKFYGLDENIVLEKKRKKTECIILCI